MKAMQIKTHNEVVGRNFIKKEGCVLEIIADWIKFIKLWLKYRFIVENIIVLE